MFCHFYSVQKIGVYYWKVKTEDLPEYGILDHSSEENRFYYLPPLEYKDLAKVKYIIAILFIIIKHF